MSEERPVESRRRFLKGAGAVTVMLLGGGVWRAMDQGVFSVGEGPAYAPWKDWHKSTLKGPLALLPSAILAANPHNSQPWRFGVSAGKIDVYADRKRNIGAIDPLFREMVMGLGCCLENLRLAAYAHGYVPRIEYLPNAKDKDHVARLHLVSGKKEVSALYEAIPRRHTHRGEYDVSRTMGDEVFRGFEAQCHRPEVQVLWFRTAAQKKVLGQAIVDATRAIIADKEQSKASHRWMRDRWRDVQRLKDGITLDATGLPSFTLFGAKMLPSLSRQSSDSHWLQATEKRHVGTAGAFGILAVRHSQDDRQRLLAGQSWQRMHLWATTKGIAVQPLNQLSERADREKAAGLPPTFTQRLEQFVPGPDWQSLMPFRIGYPIEPVGPSPRRPVSEVAKRA